jgi:hypothetical protein
MIKVMWERPGRPPQVVERLAAQLVIGRRVVKDPDGRPAVTVRVPPAGSRVVVGEPAEEDRADLAAILAACP